MFLVRADGKWQRAKASAICHRRSAISHQPSALTVVSYAVASTRSASSERPPRLDEETQSVPFGVPVDF